MGQFRFSITEGDDDPAFTEWVEEVVTNGGPSNTAVVEVAKVRQAHPDAAISIERRAVKPASE